MVSYEVNLQTYFYNKSAIDTLLAGKAASSHSHSNYLEKTQTSYKGKNVVVDNTTGNITFEDKPVMVYSNGTLQNLNMAGVETVDMIINYEDETSETVTFLQFTGGSS